MHPSAVLSHLRPKFAYILGFHLHARSQRRALSRPGKGPVEIYIITETRHWPWTGSLLTSTWYVSCSQHSHVGSWTTARWCLMRQK